MTTQPQADTLYAYEDFAMEKNASCAAKYNETVTLPAVDNPCLKKNCNPHQTADQKCSTEPSHIQITESATFGSRNELLDLKNHIPRNMATAYEDRVAETNAWEVKLAEHTKWTRVSMNGKRGWMSWKEHEACYTCDFVAQPYFSVRAHQRW